MEAMEAAYFLSKKIVKHVKMVQHYRLVLQKSSVYCNDAQI